MRRRNDTLLYGRIALGALIPASGRSTAFLSPIDTKTSFIASANPEVSIPHCTGRFECQRRATVSGGDGKRVSGQNQFVQVPTSLYVEVWATTEG